MPTHIPLSFWERESFFSGIDVVIIGSGIVGLNAALHLKEKHPRMKVVLLERGALPLGASTRNAGFACFGSLSELIDDLRNHTEEEVLALVEKRWRGLQRLRERVGDAAMDFSLSGNYELFVDRDDQTFEACRERIDEFNQKLKPFIGSDAIYRIADEKIGHFGFGGVRHLIVNAYEGQLHTGKMMRRLLSLAQEKGVEVFNGIAVTGVEDGSIGATLFTEQGWEIRAGKVLIVTNGFARRLLPELPVIPARNQVLITQPIENLRVNGCFHYDRGYFYFRNVGNRILFGGGRNLAPQTEQTDAFGTTDLIQNVLSEMLRSIILPSQSFEIDTWWSGILGLGDQKQPIVRMISNHIGVAVRLGGMGVAIGSLVGTEGAELIAG